MSGDLLFPPEGSDPRGARTRELVTSLLDRGYEEAAGAVVRGVARGMTSGIVAQRLDELEAEAARLAEAGERLTPDNPVLRALLADMEAELDAGADALNAAAGAVQEAGAEASTTLTRELAVGGMDPNVLAQIGVRWNVPDPEAVARAVGFVTSDAWAAEVARFPGLALETVRNQAIMGIADGWGPRRTARAIRQSVEGFPAHQANNLMRTLQLQSYRAGAAVNQQANETILSGVIRIATLDDRVCMACLALHGTRYPVGTVIQDHHQGRCVGIPEVRGVPRTVQTGPDWFDGLPEDRQIAIAGPGAAAALKAGEVRLQDFVEPYTDPVFGEMLRQGSLRRARELQS